jgi:hypothetical protein
MLFHCALLAQPARIIATAATQILPLKKYLNGEKINETQK